MSQFLAGDTFLAPSPRTPKLHLTIVLADPSGIPPTIITVSLNTKTTFTDSTVLLKVGDHPFISRETAVSYDEMLCIPCAHLEQLEAINHNRSHDEVTFKRHQPVSVDLLERIIDGALKSDLAPKGLVRQLRERLGITG